MDERHKICLAGAAGRMGRRVVDLLGEHPRLLLAAALERKDCAVEALACGGNMVQVTSDAEAAVRGADVVIDFSAPAVTAHVAPLCAEHRVACVVASTGLTEVDELALAEAAKRVAVLQAANLSLGVNVMLELVETAAQRLGEFEAEIFEIHHRYKRDAPSGTALALGRAVQAGRGTLRQVMSRSGVGAARESDELGYAAARGGDVAGEHTVFLLGEGERLELTHRATTPDIFARGALKAAEWLVDQPPGRYSMRNVLNPVTGRP